MNIDFSNLKILVVGDVMLDYYLQGDVKRISPEAPVPVVAVKDSFTRLGGACNVAMNLKSLGANVSLLGITGADDFAKVCLDLLKEEKISFFNVETNAKTIVKNRIVSNEYHMLRLDFEERFSEEAANSLAQKFYAIAPDFDGIIFSDYAKGSLHFVSDMLKFAKDKKIFTLVDPKSNDFSNYSNANVVKPNYKEFQEIELHKDIEEKFKDDADRARYIIKNYKIENLLITKGKDGMECYTANQTYYCNARNVDVKDVTGAGDIVASSYTLMFLQSRDIQQSIEIAALTASIGVEKFGTTSVSIDALSDKLFLKRKEYLLTREKMLPILNKLKEQGNRIVMTNGCYDVIHFGHTRYLQAARAHGDILIVAINNDASVKRLKGDSRPIYNEQERAEVLCALGCVDYVVEFCEDTPGKIIEYLTPDVLVKGSEKYKTVEEYPEGEGIDHVLINGGQVHLYDRTQGCSSTNAIEVMQQEKDATNI